MPTLLIVSRTFPPIGSAGGSIRLVKFIKYNASKGWKFIVLTQHPEYSVVSEACLSAILEEEIPPETEIIRVPAPFTQKCNTELRSGEPKLERWQKFLRSKILDYIHESIVRILCRILPGTSLWWGLRVFWQGLGQTKRKYVDLVYAVTPPFTNALAGILISCFARKPLILDMKDDWVGSPDFYKKSSWRKAIETQMERLIIRHSKRVVLVTEKSYQVYKRRYTTEKNPNKFQYIPNGCDLDEYQILGNQGKQIPTNRFLIMSAAWGYQKNYRDITPFITALNCFFQRNPHAKQYMEILLLGSNLSPEYNELLLETSIQPLIKIHEPVVREQFTEWLWKADLFFLVQPVGNTTAISGTLYEYWAVSKAPILLIAENGASSDLVEKYHLGCSFRFEDIKSISNYIEEIYTAHQNHQPKTISSNGIEAFDRKVLASQMETIWQDCLK
jgi:glycosyltransferase involved in cell wall biosynthesis